MVLMTPSEKEDLVQPGLTGSINPRVHSRAISTQSTTARSHTPEHLERAVSMTMIRQQRITAGCLLLLSWWATITVHGLASVAVVHNDRRPPNVVVYYDALQALHRDLYYHPEQPARITKCLAAIRGSAAFWLQPPTTMTEDGAATRRIRLVDCAPDDHGDVDDQQHDYSSLSTTSLSSSSTTTTPEPVRSSQPEPEREQRRPITAAELEYAEYLLRQIHAPDLVQNLQEKSRQAQARRRADGKTALGHVSVSFVHYTMLSSIC
jgi:hypothetical protein